MIWANVDTAEPMVTYHPYPQCRHVLKWSGGAEYKGSGQMAEDGGWMQFPTIVSFTQK